MKNEINTNRTNIKKIFYASMLVVGSAIGAGVLALPVVAGRAGLLPSCGVCVITCLMMAMTAWIMGKKYIENEQMQSVQQYYETTLGSYGKHVASFLFIALSALLMVSYIKGMGCSFAEVFSLKGMSVNASVVGVWVLFSGLMFCGSHRTKVVNSVLVIAKAALFAILLIPCFKGFQVKNAQFVDWSAYSTLFPIFLGAFDFQIAMPAICRQAETKKNLFCAIAIGLGTTLLIYVVFLVGTLGVLPTFGDKISIDYAFKNGLPVTVVLGNLFRNSQIFGLIGLGFPMIAMSTSFIGVTEGFTQFISDGLRKKFSRSGILWILLPAILGLILLSGESFVQAMVWAGIIVELLFGLLPCLAWFKDSRQSNSKTGMIASALLFALFALTAYLEVYAILSYG